MSSSSRNPEPRRAPRIEPPDDVRRIDAEITRAFGATDEEGRVVAASQFGVYAFYDFDGEPIYVGQTAEGLRVRIRRHLTNRRTDAVAMAVLDPFEVKDVAMWPLWELEGKSGRDREVKAYLDRAEFTVFQRVLGESTFSAVLNEKDVPSGDSIELGEPVRRCIIPEDMRAARKHPDTRIARRAATIARLAHMISERKVSTGLRRTLLTQARRLEHLASQRFDEAGGERAVEDQELGEEV